MDPGGGIFLLTRLLQRAGAGEDPLAVSRLLYRPGSRNNP
jgi:hypothetical protein